MAINWNGLISEIVDMGSESYEARVRKIILFAGAIGLVLIVVWRLTK